MMWVPKLGAFRAGTLYGTEWNEENVGANSVAFGSSNIARAAGTFVSGSNNEIVTTSSEYTTLLGQYNKASGYNHFISGNGNEIVSSANACALGGGGYIDGDYGMTHGYYCKASGIGSFAQGYAAVAKTIIAGNATANDGYGQIAMGYAPSGKTVKAEKTGSIALGESVNALTNPNIIVIGRDFSTTVQDSFNIGFGQVDYEFKATTADFKDSKLLVNEVKTDTTAPTDFDLVLWISRKPK
jgi:hypothetical protein